MMSPKERLLAPLKGMRPDRPAWAADLTYWYNAMKKSDCLSPKYEGKEGFKLLHQEMGICCYYGLSGTTFKAIFDGVENTVQEDNGIRIRRWKTPKGELTDRWEYIEQSYCWAHVEYAVKTPEQLAVLKDIFERTHYRPDYQSFTEAAGFLGDSGVPISPLPRSPLPALLADWCGVVNTIYLLMDSPGTVREILDTIGTANEQAFEFVVESPAELFHFCDNLDSLSSTSYFTGYMEEYYTRRLQQLHEHGKFAAVHLDGAVKGLLPKLAACGFDSVEAITPKPVGDVDVEECKKLVGNGKTVLWGGIPGAMFCQPWREEDIRAHTEKVLEEWDGDGRLIIGSADQIPPDGNISLCKVIAEIIEGE
ncbi:MAG: uroporphyrinogen decarboxylase family protein [bacterium]|nr:uroporphyrinogen decarboxylase family protein [bacterium]